MLAELLMYLTDISSLQVTLAILSKVLHNDVPIPETADLAPVL